MPSHIILGEPVLGKADNVSICIFRAEKLRDFILSPSSLALCIGMFPMNAIVAWRFSLLVRDIPGREKLLA